MMRDLRAEEALKLLIAYVGRGHVRPEAIRVVRSSSGTKACARIWGVSRAVQVGLGIGPTYVVELIDRCFNVLGCHEKVETLIHELAHIPRTFSGYVRPHNRAFYEDLKAMAAAARKLPEEVVEEICSKL